MAETTQLRAQNLFDVTGWIAVVTGGGTGIGLMCAQGLAANGAKVYITSRREEVLENARKEHSVCEGEGEIVSITSDVTKKESLEELVRKITEKEGRVDLLVCSAGISGSKASPDPQTTSEMAHHLWTNDSFENWNSVFQTNVTSVYFTTLAFLPLLGASEKHQKGHSPGVITISSMSGLTKSSQGHFAYNTVKAATIHLTKLMSNEFSHLKIRVNSIAPGYFPSEMTTGKSDDRQKSHIDEGYREKKGVPAGRAGSDEEMAQAVLYLAKNYYTTGEILVVDGGALLSMGTR